MLPSIPVMLSIIVISYFFQPEFICPDSRRQAWNLKFSNSNCFWYVHCTMGKFLPIFREGRYGPCCLLQLHLLAGKSITFLETKSKACMWQKDLHKYYLKKQIRQNMACQQNCTSSAIRIFKGQCNLGVVNLWIEFCMYAFSIFRFCSLNFNFHALS